MPVPSSDILQASAGGSIQLLILTGAGCALSYKEILTKEVSSSLSKANAVSHDEGVYLLFIPCLIFGSVLETTHNAIQSLTHPLDKSSIQELWVPIAAAILRIAVCSSLSIPLVSIIARGKQPAVRRVMLLCLIQGNSNTMPLLVMQSLCQGFSSFQKDPLCHSRAMGYASLFMVVTNVFSWTVFLQYILRAPDSTIRRPDEGNSILHGVPQDFDHRGGGIKQAFRDAVTSPPFISAGTAFVLSVTPNIDHLMIQQNGILRPIINSTNAMGAVVVPITCMIVGAELYRSVSTRTSREAESSYEEEKMGTSIMLFIIVMRMFLLPLLCRALYVATNTRQYIANPILGIFVIVQWGVPTANITVVMVNMAAEKLPRIGEQLRHDISRCVFYQILVTPILLTLNTAFALRIQYPFN